MKDKPPLWPVPLPLGPMLALLLFPLEMISPRLMFLLISLAFILIAASSVSFWYMSLASSIDSPTARKSAKRSCSSCLVWLGCWYDGFDCVAARGAGCVRLLMKAGFFWICVGKRPLDELACGPLSFSVMSDVRWGSTLLAWSVPPITSPNSSLITWYHLP